MYWTYTLRERAVHDDVCRYVQVRVRDQHMPPAVFGAKAARVSCALMASPNAIVAHFLRGYSFLAVRPCLD